jgi:hypothetical protein
VLTSLAALSAAVCVSQAAFAQQPPPGAPPAPSAADQQRWAERMREHQEARAHALHDILNIRPDQDAAFQAFLAAMRPPEGGMRERRDMSEMQTLTTPQRLDRMAERMAQRQAEFQRRAAAIKAFYAVLSPAQQRAFDALHGMMGGHGGQGKWGGGMRGGPGREGPHGAD